MTEPLPALPNSFDSAAAEASVSSRWDAASAFHADPTSESHVGAYSVVIPPPNVTAALHLGHALNNTLQDVLVRYHRMTGHNTMWMPGTDHAGIATQTVVEKRLLNDGVKRLELGREKFIEKTQEWKEEYEATILSQLKSMGASCDFDRTRFTMDEVCATSVRHAFYQLFADGLIYRGKRLVNWDPATQTALADDEVEMEEVPGHMWYLRYPLADGSGHVTVATTRPETMFGDTAVAVNPDDPRAAGLQGKSVRLPIVNREIPIVEDDYVVMPDPDSSEAKAQIATGFLKVTPAHDPNDWDIGLRHDLAVINVMGPDASITDQYGWEDASADCGPFLGLSREDARTAVVDWFEANGLLEEVREYSHSVGHSYRSHVPIEPWLSDQWYVRVTDDRLRGAALRAQHPDQVTNLESKFTAGTEAGDGGLQFFPVRYARTFQTWHENLRDWCISRQLWWGHQIPVWSLTRALADCPANVVTASESVPIGEAAPVTSVWTASGAAHTARRLNAEEIVENVCVPADTTLQRLERSDSSMDEAALVAALEADGYVRDPDVLDTWFSSGLWPMSTMGWPYPEDFPEQFPNGAALVDTFNPTSLLSTAREIITLWVSRMVMFNRYFMDGQLPFADVFIHAMVQDGHGQKMSKSLGNGVDPRDIIFSHGADAMRFTLVQMTTDTQDVRLPVDMVCAHSGEMFTPEFITTSAGHLVAAAEQVSPTDPSKKMVSAYGVAVGAISPSSDAPLARNTSSKFDLGRNFSNKLFNAVKFALNRLENAADPGAPVDISTARFADRLIVSRLQETIGKLDAATANYQFNVYADTLYDFIWRDVCDRYLEAVKPTIDDSPDQQVILGAVLDASLRLMHPVCPFITESLWPYVSAARVGSIAGLDLPPNELLTTAAWPTADAGLGDPAIGYAFERVWNLITQIRQVRSQQQVKPRKQIILHAPAAVTELITSADGLVETLAGIARVHPAEDGPPPVSSPLVFEGSQLFLSGLADEVDLDAERARLTDRIAALTNQIGGFNAKLSNDGYLNGAPPHMVQETRNLLAAAEADLEAAQTALDGLGA